MTCLDNVCGGSCSGCQGTDYRAQNDEDEENKYGKNNNDKECLTNKGAIIIKRLAFPIGVCLRCFGFISVSFMLNHVLPCC